MSSIAIAEDLEDRRAATVISAIDFEKAFNRLLYQHYLRAFAIKEASNGVLRLLATFLSNRKMSVRIGSTSVSYTHLTLPTIYTV